LFQNRTATTPLAISTTTVIYVLYGSTTTTTTTTQTCNGVTCRVTYTYRLYAPPSPYLD
jgi:hypothetical protein